jgi:hypothetical protein
VKRGMKAAAAIGAVAFVAIGLLHTSWGKPLLMKLGGCPVGKASAAEIEQVRMKAIAETRGQESAPARPAIGWELDSATPEDVMAWAKAHGVTCTEKREGMFLSCKDVPVSAVGDRDSEPGTIDDVSFSFRPRDRALVNVTVTSYSLPAPLAASRATSAAARLEGTVGAPTTRAGDATTNHLSSGAYATASTTWRFADYQAEVTATAFAGRGVAVREHYVSGRD